MPRRVKSLKDAALFAIAKNINYWNDMIPEDPDSYLYLLSPFDVLDHGLTQDIFDTLVKYNAFLPSHIHLLFHANLHSIDLSKCANFNLGGNSLKTLFKRSKKIKNLKISGRTRYSKLLINVIPRQYPNLQSITLTHENICGEFVSNLVTYCPALITFVSSSCTKIADESFKMFAQLQDIKALTLGNADALSDDSLLFILMKCKKLISLSLPMARTNFKLVEGMTFASLRSLDLTLSDSIDDTSVERITTSFTCLKDLCLSNCDHITNKSLQIITCQCKYLENLNISYSGIKKYSGDVEVLLMEIGYKLRSVDFSGISNIRTTIFGQYCSHLEKLFLNHCPCMVGEWIPYEMVVYVIERNSKHNDRFLNGMIHQLGKRSRYSMLELCPLMRSLQLDLGKTRSVVLGFDLESIIRGGHNLEMLSLIALPNFTDQDIKNMDSYMDIGNIKHLNLSGNSLVTLDGIWYAIEHMGNLQTLEIKDCDVLRNEFDQLKSQLLRKGYDLEVVGFT